MDRGLPIRIPYPLRCTSPRTSDPGSNCKLERNSGGFGPEFPADSGLLQGAAPCPTLTAAPALIHLAIADSAGGR